MISSVSSSYNQSYYLEMRQQMFNNIDTDGDGKHSREEITAMIANGPQGGPSVDDIFSKADTDGDGYISQSEFEAYAPSNQQKQGGGSELMGCMSSADFLQQMFDRIDTDGDEKHSREEITAMVANGPQGGPSVDDIFSKADTDGDGYISESEFDAGQEQGASPVQSSDSTDDLITSLLEALESEDDTTSTTAVNESQSDDSAATLAQMLSAALQSYLQNAGCFSQSTVASTLLGSNVYA